MVERVAGDVREGLALVFWELLAEEAAIGKVGDVRRGNREGKE